MFYHLITSFTLPPLMDTLYIHIEHFAEKYKYLVAVYICKLILQFSTNINRLKFKLINFMYISDFKVLEFYLKIWFNISTSKWEILYLWSLEIILSNYIWNVQSLPFNVWGLTMCVVTWSRWSASQTGRRPGARLSRDCLWNW